MSSKLMEQENSSKAHVLLSNVCVWCYEQELNEPNITKKKRYKHNQS